MTISSTDSSNPTGILTKPVFPIKQERHRRHREDNHVRICSIPLSPFFIY